MLSLMWTAKNLLRDTLGKKLSRSSLERDWKIRANKPRTKM